MAILREYRCWTITEDTFNVDEWVCLCPVKEVVQRLKADALLSLDDYFRSNMWLDHIWYCKVDND